MIQKLQKFLKLFLPFSLMLFALQYILVNYFIETSSYYPTWGIYLFHILATFLIYIFLIFVHNTYRDKTGFAFMACSLLKMMAAVLFLLPVMLNKDSNPLADILAFFVPYFLFLIFETTYAVRLINTK